MLHLLEPTLPALHEPHALLEEAQRVLERLVALLQRRDDALEALHDLPHVAFGAKLQEVERGFSQLEEALSREEFVGQRTDLGGRQRTRDAVDRATAGAW